jgi:hypothetical protein
MVVVIIEKRSRKRKWRDVMKRKVKRRVPRMMMAMRNRMM